MSGSLASDSISAYGPIAILVGVTGLLAVAMLGLSHVLGPGRVGPVKNTPYESGMPVFGDARRRFNVKFYLVAMLFLLFDVEVVLIWPWAVAFHHSATNPEHAINQAAVAAGIAHPPTFLLGAGAVFFGLLLVGFLYDLGKGVFRWS